MIDVTTMYDCIKDQLKETFQRFADANGLSFECMEWAYHTLDYPTWYIRFINKETGAKLQWEFDTTAFDAIVKMPAEDIRERVCEPLFKLVRKELLEVEYGE